MRKRQSFGVLAAMLLANSMVAWGQEPMEISCTDSAPEAILELPSPIDRFAQVTCTNYGHVLTSKPNWLWTRPGGYSPVFFPAQMVRDAPKPVGGQFYFKRVTVTPLTPEKREAALKVAFRGIDYGDPKAIDAYRVSLGNNEDEVLEFEVFDDKENSSGIESIWGFECQQNTDCKDGGPFLILDFTKNERRAP